MSDRDDFVRRYELERVERAVDELRGQAQRTEERRAELREADNARHSAEHDAIEARIERERERHEREHEDDRRSSKTDRQWTWNRTLAVVTAACAVVGAYYLILSHSR